MSACTCDGEPGFEKHRMGCRVAGAAADAALEEVMDTSGASDLSPATIAALLGDDETVAPDHRLADVINAMNDPRDLAPWNRLAAVAKALGLSDRYGPVSTEWTPDQVLEMAKMVDDQLSKLSVDDAAICGFRTRETEAFRNGWIAAMRHVQQHGQIRPAEIAAGPCPAHRLDGPFFCALRAGHAGMHETKEGAAWTDATPRDPFGRDRLDAPWPPDGRALTDDELREFASLIHAAGGELRITVPKDLDEAARQRADACVRYHGEPVITNDAAREMVRRGFRAGAIWERVFGERGPERAPVAHAPEDELVANSAAADGWDLAVDRGAATEIADRLGQEWTALRRRAEKAEAEVVMVKADVAKWNLAWHEQREATGRAWWSGAAFGNARSVCGCTDGTDADEPADRGFICEHAPRGFDAALDARRTRERTEWPSSTKEST
jgi:hypothetical protein